MANKKRTKKKKEDATAFLDPLSFAELTMLRDHPYDEPGRIRGTADQKTATSLVEKGLLERDPQTPSIVRCTSLGERARQPISIAAIKRVVDEVADMAQNDEEAAAGLERQLWQRILLECADGAENVMMHEAARHAVRTAQFDFRRG